MKKLYINGQIITVEDKTPKAEAIIVENGKITFVGSSEEALSLKSDHEIVDLRSKTMCPGFIDSHSHFIASSFVTTTVNLAAPPVGKVESIKDVQKSFKKCNKREKAKTW